MSGNATLGDNSTDLIKSIGSFYASSTLQSTGAVRFYSTLQADGLTILANASTTQLSLTGNLWINGFATTTNAGNIQGQGILTMLGTGTSTFSGGLEGTALNITSATASSTLANGIILSKGCFLMPDGTCAGAGGGSGTINSGTIGQFPYYAGSGTTLTATSSIFLSLNQNIGIGTTTPNWLLQVAGTRPFFTLSDTGATTDKKHWFLSNQGGNFYVGTSSDALSATSTYLTIKNNGNVGIGTTNPVVALQVTSSDVRIDSGRFYGFGASGSSGVAGEGNGVGNDNLLFNTNWIQRMIINNNGNVGIGTTSPWGLLSVNANGISGPQFVVGSSTKTDFIITNTGNIGIGTTTPTTMFQVATSTANATTTIEIGKASQNKGSCLKLYNSVGSVYYCRIDGGTLTCNTTSCE